MVLNTKTKNGMNYGAYIVRRQDGSIRVKSPILKKLVRQNGDNNFVDTDGIITIKHDQIAPCFEAIIDEHLDDTMLTSILNILRMYYSEEHVTTIEASEKVSKFVEDVTKKPIGHLYTIYALNTNNQSWHITYHYVLDQVAAIVYAKRFTVDRIGYSFTKVGEGLTSLIVTCRHCLPDVPNISVGSEIDFDIIPSIIRYPEIKNAEPSNKLLFDIIDVVEEQWHNVTIDENSVRDFNTWSKVIESFTPYTLKPLSEEQKSEFQRMISHEILVKTYRTPVMV